MLFFLFRLGVSDSFVDGEDGASSFSGCFECVDLDEEWFPDEGLLVVSDAVVDVDALVDVLFSSLV